MSIIVPGFGPPNARWMIVGEAPGKSEAFHRPRPRPFCGPSGHLQESFLNRHGLSAERDFYLTNVCKEYADGNPDPTPEQIEYWTPVLEREIAEIRPQVIIPVGRFAVQWFLGPEADMDSCHGIAHRGDEFGSAYLGRAQGAILCPSYRPAFGLHQIDARSLIYDDYGQAAKVIDYVRTGREHRIEWRVDEYAGRETYLDVTGEELEAWLDYYDPDEIGLDTEGRPGYRYEMQRGELVRRRAQWSIQVSPAPGVAFTLRTAQPDFARGIAAIQRLVDRGCVVVVHDAGTPSGCLYDTIMSREMGLELRYTRQWNTMDGAYLLRLEPKGLKPLMYRHCGMRSTDYMGLIGDIARGKQVEYLTRALMYNWPKPEPFIEYGNDGSMKVKKPQPVAQRVERILHDIAIDKRNKDDEPVDPAERWAAVDDPQREMVERKLGPLPEATLDDIDLDTAVWYACRDADATRRLKPKLVERLRQIDCLPLKETRDQVLPIFEEMQSTGMPASRRAFIDLASTVEKDMRLIQRRISHRYYGDQPFNPNSTKHVNSLLRRRGLVGAKRTKSGDTSTSKRSIEHLRREDPAIDDVFLWRERAKILGTYALPQIRVANHQLGAIDIRPVGDNAPDIFIVRGKIKPVNVETSRLAMTDPSLLNQPTRTELGSRVRSCYTTGGNGVFAGWDFSSQEVRITTDVSGDRSLIRLYTHCRYCDERLPAIGPCRRSKNGKHKAGDPHLNSACRIFGKAPEEIRDKEERLPAKTAFFGITYGLSGLGLEDLFRMQGLEDWGADRCQELIDEIMYKVYPGISEAIATTKKQTRETGMVRSRYGLIRYLPAIWSESRRESAEAGRQAFSHLISATAQGMIQHAMAWLRPRIRRLQLDAEAVGEFVRWCLQIHDELVFWQSGSMWERMDALVLEAFTQRCGIKLKVPIEAEGHMAIDWGKLK